MVKFGVIPADVICRFGELTKTEIVILSFLYLSHNSKTGRCNPSRGEISRRLKIAKSHISTAVKSLTQKGWIIERSDGNFQLLNEAQKVTNSVTITVTDSVTKVTDFVTPEVTDSVTKVTDFVTPEVTDSVTKVTDSVTKSYENRNLTPIYINKQRTDKEHTVGRTRKSFNLDFMNPTSDHAIDTLIASFPEVQFTPAQLGHINAEIQDTPIDRAAWDSTLKLYCQNYDPATRSYVPTKIGTLLKIFNETKSKLEKEKNGIRISEREKSAQRGSNAIDLINELRRQGSEEQALLSGNSGHREKGTVLIESTELNRKGIGSTGDGLARRIGSGDSF